MNIKTWS